MRPSSVLQRVLESPFISAKSLVNGSRVPVDATWFMPNVARKGHAEFLANRIPGARFFDVDAVSDGTSPFPHMLPTPSHFSRAMGRLGIRRSDDLCIYDVQGLFAAARVYWTFKVFNHAGSVKILRGGLAAYEKAGLPLESGPVEALQEVEYGDARLDQDMVVQFDEIVKIARKEGSYGDVQVLDARPSARFTGAAKEPREGLESGHVPNSLSLPFSELVSPEGEMIPEEQLRELLHQKGVNLDSPIVATCGSGVTACVIAVSLESIGVQARVYDESWTGYADSSRAGKLPGMIVKG
ncbi:3-mercaptopyruvate sulfurtransferase [Taphrina deformans PYCC 5710]|uniref:3-mercaptopyruvate sulfurtransferase n=1 Tax=Taphrina deformans (strain PYCC 5710 / ATCC 11124 / CBS 356.35 / IMI 108563 / JCM 9778 / NBRC 8474) TaxID=1097556 RepID=R4XBY9_TAPDE|nr:3-mercaptopyruvate sulfurtransferase [Taphrina deformans PYCC 5710]|eukprot:CCG83324.1 3-mercaptopyruvate sulfurtransferase [Taphrina deformans PYCC 5710]